MVLNAEETDAEILSEIEQHIMETVDDMHEPVKLLKNLAGSLVLMIETLECLTDVDGY